MCISKKMAVVLKNKTTLGEGGGLKVCMKQENVRHRGRGFKNAKIDKTSFANSPLL